MQINRIDKYGVIYLWDLESTKYDNTLELVKDRITKGFMELPNTIVVPIPDIERFHKIFNSNIFKLIKDIMEKYDEYFMWYIGEVASIENVETKYEILNIINQHLENHLIDDEDVKSLVEKFKLLLLKSIKTGLSLMFIF